jgi:hypothetical protein
MTLPGFSAEASLSPTSTTYRSFGRFTAATAGLYPALGPEPDVDSKCFWDCYEDCIGPCTEDCKHGGGE